MTEGRSTGIPTLQDELHKNGSPRATIETNEERSYINIFIPVHEGCGDVVELNVTKDVTKDVKKDVKKDVRKDVKKELSKRQCFMLKIMEENPTITIPEMSLKIGVTTRTISRDLAEMMDFRVLERDGGRKEGGWVIVKKDVVKDNVIETEQKIIRKQTENEQKTDGDRIKTEQKLNSNRTETEQKMD